MAAGVYRIKLTPLHGHEQYCPQLHYSGPVPRVGGTAFACVNVKAVVTGVALEPASPMNMAPARRVYEVSAVEVPLAPELENVGRQVQSIIAAAADCPERAATCWGQAIVDGLAQAGYEIRCRNSAGNHPVSFHRQSNAPLGEQRERRLVLVWP